MLQHCYGSAHSCKHTKSMASIATGSTQLLCLVSHLAMSTYYVLMQQRATSAKHRARWHCASYLYCVMV